MKITVLIPAYNEQSRIGKTLEAVCKIKGVDQVVVIDDGSTDDTAAIAATYPIQLLKQTENRGKGQALNRGWQSNPADVYLLLDADLGESASFGASLLTPLLADDAEMSIANFIVNQSDDPKQKMGFGLAKKTASWGIRQLTGYHFQSPLSGQRGVKHQVLVDSEGFAPGFGVEVALTVAALRHGHRVVEVDLPMTHRATGRDLSGFIHRAKQLGAIGNALYQAWRNY